MLPVKAKGQIILILKVIKKTPHLNHLIHMNLQKNMLCYAGDSMPNQENLPKRKKDDEDSNDKKSGGSGGDSTPGCGGKKKYLFLLFIV
jgi:hypothetical protein